MGKRWCVSSKRARVDVAKAFVGIAAVFLLTGATPDPSPSPSPDSGFMLLPLAEIAASPAAGSALRVGDAIRLKVRGSGIGPALKLATPIGSEPLGESGWQVLAVDQTVPDLLEVEAVVLKAGAPLVLPALVVQDPSGKGVARTPSLSFQVATAIQPNDPKPQEPVGMRPPVGLPFPFWVLAVLLLAVAVSLAGIVWGVNRWLKKKRKFELPAMPEGPPKTEDQAALDELEELEKQGLIRRGQYKMHYFRVSEIAKRYIGRRYAFDAPESTSREIVTALEEAKIMGDEWIDRVETLFEKLDRAKFTDYVPEADEGGVVLAEVRKLVLGTRKPPPAPSLTPSSVGGPRAS